MRVLGLDTATPATAVALLDTVTGDAHEGRDDPPPGARPRHATRLLVLVAEVLDAVGLGYDGIDLIAVGIGPGTFTGLRIGVASARALAGARELPIVGVGTLQALAAAAAQDPAAAGRDVLAVIDARRREVFAAGWRGAQATVAGAQPQPPVRALAPSALADALADSGQRWLAVGDGAVGSRSVLASAEIEIPGDESRLHRVSALHHCRLAMGLSPGRPDDIQPEYGRVPDAELARQGC